MYIKYLYKKAKGTKGGVGRHKVMGVCDDEDDTFLPFRRAFTSVKASIFLVFAMLIVAGHLRPEKNKIKKAWHL